MIPLSWLNGDGGPLVLLQSSALPAWEGAANFDNSIMNGGTVETDYDVICRCGDGIHMINYRNRDMLVMGDSEWAGTVFDMPQYGLVFIQNIGFDEAPSDYI